MRALFLLAAAACASDLDPAPQDLGYPFVGIREPARTEAAARARTDYPEFFRAADDSTRTEELDTREVRRDLSRVPVLEGNYRALEAIALAFFGLHARAEEERGRGRYFAYSFQATKLIAIPWRLYGEIPDPKLRSAILDFYEDVLFGDKAGLVAVRGRYTRVVEDLVRKETDPTLRGRIEEMVERAQEGVRVPVR